jgi:hypothetical protein
MALGISAMIAAPCLAQGARPNGAQNRPPNQPPKQQQRPAQRQGQRQQQQEARKAQNERQNTSANRPPNSNANRPVGATNNNLNRPPSAYTPPKRNFNDLSAQDRQKVLENYKNFQKLPPAQRQQRKEAADNWGKLSPEQKNHIRNDVIPKWKQLPPDRQRAISQRLGVLKNMPESARNQHLNDPNFTRGMSEEDKATLKDLSHMHVGGAPDPPSE